MRLKGRVRDPNELQKVRTVVVDTSVAGTADIVTTVEAGSTSYTCPFRGELDPAKFTTIPRSADPSDLKALHETFRIEEMGLWHAANDSPRVYDARSDGLSTLPEFLGPRRDKGATIPRICRYGRR